MRNTIQRASNQLANDEKCTAWLEETTQSDNQPEPIDESDIDPKNLETLKQELAAAHAEKEKVTEREKEEEIGEELLGTEKDPVTAEWAEQFGDRPKLPKQKKRFARPGRKPTS